VSAPPTLVDPYHPEVTAGNFDVGRWIAQFDERLLRLPEGRRLLTRLDPMLFALVYLRHHLASDDTGGEITYADCHFAWYRLMRTWVRRERSPRGWRHAFAAPRSAAKSTHWFLFAPVWAGAHGHARFIAAFADSGTQAEMHLQTFRSELAHNPLLRSDYPEFCRAMRKPTGRTVADNEGMYQCCNGFVFAARGADTATLGMKVSERRPDVLLLDDVEKHEALYSLDMVAKRKETIVNAIFPLNERARVVIVGTVTRPGSLVHQLVQIADRQAEPTGDHAWIREERIVAHHHLPIVDGRDGRRSIWPAKWPLDYLESIEGTRSYDLNFRCDPSETDGEYWSSTDFLRGVPGPIGRIYCWVDPPVTTKKGSDPAGIAIVGYLPEGIVDADEAVEGLPAEHQRLVRARLKLQRRGGRSLPGAIVLHAEEVRLTGRPLMRHVAATITRFSAASGWRVRGVLAEANQGGDLWTEAAEDLALPFRTFTSSAPKDVRFKLALDYYQAGRVVHVGPLPALERQMLAWPRVSHDDVIDGATQGILAFLEPVAPGKRSKTIFPS